MAKSVSTRGIRNTKAAFADAGRRLAERTAIVDPDPNLPRNGIKAGEWEGAPWDAMPPDCPVQVLGHNGPITYCVSATGQLHAIERWDAAVLAKLFAPYLNYAFWAWPAKASPGKDENGDPLPAVVKRLERDKAMFCLIQEGSRKGLFDPLNRLRGRGGWRDAADRFVWHSGEYMWTMNGANMEAAIPGDLDGYLYMRAPDITRPWEETVPADDSPAHTILKYLRTWSWERPELDPLLFLGWLVTGYMGGALDWRPIVLTTGGAGVGKSTLHGVIKGIYGRALHAAADTTAAGLYQRIKNDSLPAIVDELENKAGSNKSTAVVELARIASSGAPMYRGGADHEGVEFTLMCSFLFSAINPPPLMSQDKSRMAILNLARLDKSRTAKEIVVRDHDGRMLLRQIMEGWKDFHAEILPRWKLALHGADMSSRAQDTYGTLMAAAELVLGQEALHDLGFDPTEMDAVAAAIAAATASEVADQIDNWQLCLERLFGSTIDTWKSGERPTVGAVLEDLQNGATPLDFDNARARLVAAGLGLRKQGDPCVGYALAIPPKGPALERIFADTEWGKGVWTGALKQGPKEVILRNGEKRVHNMKINKSSEYCILVDLDKYDELTGH